MKTEYTPEEVIEELKRLTGCTTDQEVAEVLGTGKQNLFQFKKGKQQDIKMKIIALLLNSKKPSRR
ncbi:hypothetical protein A1OW_13410 [Enterovibrio norvegicus]|uniref:hypothetical protein n=1 Tax=Enterovibrio norvegicus TaxID=188144 RepID=UPI00031EBD0D|nr:hypothetical protein [Enterovibrio norvegicus]OEF49192.1 hypothetical protein A1OW_13410 [Enterovibrio norvegicus]